MKKIFTLAAGVCSFCVSEATIRTVSNNSNSPGQYTTLQAAINVANAGDTIYVHGSNTSYGNITVNKRLTIIGTGHNPNKSNPLVSQLGNVQLDSVANASGGSGSKIIGFKLTEVLGYAGAGGTKNITLARNYFVSTGTKINVTNSGWLIKNNILFGNIVVNNKSNIFIENNIFSGGSVTTSNLSSLLITNNIFLGTSPATCFTTLSNALITNNIFLGVAPNGTNVTTNTFDNNITYQTISNTLPFGTNVGSGNFSGQDPQFMNVPANAFSYSYDFTLMAGSPGKNAGTDGTDIGAYGGPSPFVDLTGSPAIPQVKSLTILNPMIPVGDSLHVVIKAKKQN
ncbi:MAG: hypothetical protein ACHQHP_03345 [Bacteroidia bacterium]